MPNTVRLHRVLVAKPEKVYRAFIEADALAKWLPPNGFACTVHQLDAKVGGAHRMSFRPTAWLTMQSITNRSPPNSLLIGKLTGNFAESGHPSRFSRLISARIQ